VQIFARRLHRSGGEEGLDGDVVDEREVDRTEDLFDRKSGNGFITRGGAIGEVRKRYGHSYEKERGT